MRRELTEQQRQWGRTLGKALQRTRQEKEIDIGALAVGAGVSVDTIRSIESGRLAAPGFFTIAAISRRLELDLDKLARRAMRSNR